MGNTASRNFYSNCENLNVANIVNVNGIVNCASNLTGQDSNSTSPSDIILFDFVPNTNYNGEIITKGFQKLFVSNYDELYSKFPVPVTINGKIDNDIYKRKIDILFYEYYIYMDKIKPLVEKNINPHFIKVLGGKLDVSVQNLKRYILDKATTKNDLLKNTFLGVNACTVNMIDNLIYMMHELNTRKSLTKNTLTSSLVSNRLYFFPSVTPKNLYNDMSLVLDNAKFGFILTEGVDVGVVDTFSDFLNLPLNKSIFLSKFLRLVRKHANRAEILPYVYYIYFQIFSACYAMYLTGINHNDLHSSNIWIKKTEPHINEYHLGNKVYRVLVDYKIMIYDFDRSYCESYNNLKPYNNIFSQLSQYNAAVRNSLFLFKDILKVSLELYYDFKMTDEKDDFLGILTSDKVNLKRLFSTKNSDGNINYWIEDYITKSQLNESNYNNIQNIFDEMFNRFDAFNDKRMNANPRVREYIYVCKPSVFKDGNILDNTFKVVQENVVKEAAKLWLNERKVNNEFKTQLEKSEKDVTELTNMLQDEINEKKKFENDAKTCNTQLEKSNKEKTNLNKILQEEIVKKVRFENDAQVCNTQLEKLKEKLKEVREEKYEKPLEEKKVEKVSEKKSPQENELEKIYNELKDFDCSLRGGKWNLEELKKLNNKLKDKFDLKTGLKSSDKKQVFCETLKKVLEKKLNKS
jgi:hypothetical protein